MENGRRIVQQILDNDFDIAEYMDSSDSDKNSSFMAKIPRLPNKERNHLANHERLMANYFNSDSTYNNCDFCRRFRMEKGLVKPHFMKFHKNSNQLT